MTWYQEFEAGSDMRSATLVQIEAYAKAQEQLHAARDMGSPTVAKTP